MERVLEVRVMFEPNRLEAEYLADAYERVVPMVRRALRGRNPSMKDLRGGTMRRAGGAGA